MAALAAAAPLPVTVPVAGISPVGDTVAAATAAASVPASAGPLSDAVSLAILAAAGLPVSPFAEVQSRDAALEFGYPVVIKGLIDGLPHKSDHGLVETGILDAAQCAAASASTRLLAAGAVKLVIQPHVQASLEALAGLITEPNLGRYIVFGLGGIFAEALQDAAVLPVEASPDEIASALHHTRLGAILLSPRLRAPGAFSAMTDVLVKLAGFARNADPRLEAIDINPLLVSGNNITAVDALIVLTGEPAEPGQRARARRRTH